jgi:uncharacterized protein DUF4062
MKLSFSAMEYFGSRTDEPVAACRKEIDACSFLIGIYAWRYGWQPAEGQPSITEEEFLYAVSREKRCLCYVVDESHPWPPIHIDQGRPAQLLRLFKVKVSQLVRSKFTTPDNLAMQVAADIAREAGSPSSAKSFGGLLSVNWEVFSPELQLVLSTAYQQARVESSDGVVATRHVVTALANSPNSASPLFAAYRKVPIQPIRDDLPPVSLPDLFHYDKPMSSCVLASMERLLPHHSPTQRLLAIELAVDLLKNGHGTSVANFREAGIDAQAVDRTVRHIRSIASDNSLLGEALDQLSEAEVLHISYLAGVPPSDPESGTKPLRGQILKRARESSRILLLIGELMRRHPKLVVIE